MTRAASVLLTFFLAQALNAGIQANVPADHSLAVQKVWLRKGIQAFPETKDGGATVSAINASLAEYDKKVLRAAEECDTDLAGSEIKTGEDKENWTRTVDVTLHGPHYISYVAKDKYFCGGAYPNAWVFALVYDLKTGKVVDWTKLLVATTSQSQSNSDGSESQTVSSASLAKVYLAKILPKLDKDCADAIRSEDFASGFSLWPDAKSGSLVLHPNLSHAVAACGEDISLNVEEQRSVGVAEEMIGAIQAGHAAVGVSK